MNEYNQQLTVLRCFRCGHQWTPQAHTVSRSCARCKSKQWQSPRVKGSHLPIFEALELGESITLPLVRDSSGGENMSANSCRVRALWAYAKKSGKSFRLVTDSAHGHTVTRVI